MIRPLALSQNPESLATLREMTRALNSSLKLDEGRKHVTGRVIEVPRAESGCLMLHGAA